jgi:Fe-S-cluster containining protein
MIRIECEWCANHCCGQNLNLTPVLLPSEEDRFRENVKKINTPSGEICVLAKKQNGNCTFLDDQTKRCTIYEKRPLECALYPFLLDFDDNEADVKLDKRFCPHLHTLAFDRNEIMNFVRKHTFPVDWVKRYKTLSDV